MSETSPKEIPELGRKVIEVPGGLPDYGALIEWAKDQDIPPSDNRLLRGIVGDTDITIMGERAALGWVGGGERTAPFSIENRGGENLVVVEGGFMTSIVRSDKDGTATRSQNIAVAAHRGQPFRLSLLGGDVVTLSHPYGPDGKAWYVRFYPEPKPA